MWAEISSAKSENRHELNLSGSFISKLIEDEGLDSNLFTLLGLNFLNISDTCLNEISTDIGKLVNLTNLCLNGNKICQLPTTIGHLTKLKMLDISRNTLISVPEEIQQLVSLSTLNLSSNALSTLPSMINNVKLSVLDLSNNKFEEFPDICHPELVNLAEVKLNTNKIKEIPGSINCLVALKYFEIADNALVSVPGELADIGKLKEINLKGNKLSDKRLLKLVDQCRSKQVLDYVRQHCARAASGDGGGSTGGGGGKGKKGKKGKKADQGGEVQHSDDTAELCHKLHILHVRDETPFVKIDDSVKAVRPHILCCVVSGVTFTAESLKRFITLQTKLHAGICERRVAATIATHDLALLPAGAPLLYTACLPQKLKIRPLGRNKELSGAQLFAQLQREAEDLRKEKKKNTYSGIHRFLYLLEGKPVFPCLQDSTGRVVSFPPITNSDGTKISLDTRDMFIEVTSATSHGVCRKVLDALLRETLDLGLGTAPDSEYNSLTVEQVKVVDLEGNLRAVYPSRSDAVFEEKGLAVVRD